VQIENTREIKMTKIKTFMLAAIAAGALFATAPAYADLKFGVDISPYPPFTSKDPSGVIVGWEGDFMAALCAEIKEKCAFEPTAWDGIIPALQAKKFDAILSSMSVTPERKKTIDYSMIYYNSAAVIIGEKGEDKDFSPEHLSGKTIGVQSATTHANYLDKYYKPKGAIIKGYAGQDEANADLTAGRVDYIMADGVTLGAYLDSEAGACCEQKGAVPIDVDILGPGVGVGIRKEDTALLEKINAGIVALRDKGFFEANTEKWHLTGKLILPKDMMK
jgi:polar amino acid transport system substrate-binding protein